MNEPQLWVLIGLFAAIMVGGFTITSTLMMHAMNARFDGVEGTMNARFEAVEATVGARFEGVNAKFEKVYAKIDHLDRDVAAGSRQIFGGSGE